MVEQAAATTPSKAYSLMPSSTGSRGDPACSCGQSDDCPAAKQPLCVRCTCLRAVWCQKHNPAKNLHPLLLASHCALSTVLAQVQQTFSSAFSCHLQVLCRNLVFLFRLACLLQPSKQGPTGPLTRTSSTRTTHGDPRAQQDGNGGGCGTERERDGSGVVASRQRTLRACC